MKIIEEFDEFCKREGIKLNDRQKELCEDLLKMHSLWRMKALGSGLSFSLDAVETFVKHYTHTFINPHILKLLGDTKDGNT